MADAAKKNDFAQATDILMIRAPDKKLNTSRVQRVSAARTGKIKVGPKTGVEIRFYKRRERPKLIRDERDEMMEIRKNQTGNKKRKKNGRENDQAAKIMALEAQLQEQIQNISALTTSKDSVPLLPLLKNPSQPPSGFTQ